MKILFILNLRHNKSGITEQVLYLKKKLTEEGYQINLVSTFGNIISRIKGIINSFAIANESDLIVGVGCSYAGFFPIIVAALAAFFMNKKIIYNYHGGQAEKYFAKYNYILKYIFRQRKIIVATGYLENVFKKFGYEVTVINNFFDFSTFPLRNNEFKWNKRVLWARSFENLYQPELALKAAEYLSKNNGFEFHFFGDGALYNNLRKQYENDKIIFHGLIEREKLLEEYQNFSILLNTTLNDNIPNTISEAGYYKLLVISSRVGGISTSFTDSEIKYTERIDEKSFIEALLEVMNETEKYNTVREKLNKKILNYRWENVRLEWLSVINTESESKREK